MVPSTTMQTGQDSPGYFSRGLQLFHDWFVCTLASPVKRWVAALCDIVDGDGASMDQKRALFGRTARKLYRLPN